MGERRFVMFDECNGGTNSEQHIGDFGDVREGWEDCTGIKW